MAILDFFKINNKSKKIKEEDNPFDNRFYGSILNNKIPVNNYIDDFTLTDKYEEIEKLYNVSEVVSLSNIYISKLQGKWLNIKSKDLKKVELLTKVFNNIDLKAFIRDCSLAREYGYSVLEIVDWTSIDGVIVPNKVIRKPCKWFKFNVNNELLFVGKKENLVINKESEYFHKFIVIKHKETFANPYGESLLQQNANIVMGLLYVRAWMLQYIENNWKGKWFGKAKEGAKKSELEELASTLEQLRNSGVAVFRENIAIEYKETVNSSSLFVYDKANEILNKKLNVAWLGSELFILGEKGGYSSSSLGNEVSDEVLSIGVSLFEQGAAQLVKLIYPDDQDTIITINSVTKKSIEEVETDIKYFSLGSVKPTKQFFINRGYDESEFEIVNKNGDFSKENKVKEDYEFLLKTGDEAFAKGYESIIKKDFAKVKKKQTIDDLTESYLSFAARVGALNTNDVDITKTERFNSTLIFGAGQQHAIEQNKDIFKYWEFHAKKDARARASHKALDGKIFNSNNMEYFPPLSFGCRCTVTVLDELPEGSETTPQKELKNDDGAVEFKGLKIDSLFKFYKKVYVDKEFEKDAIAFKLYRSIINIIETNENNNG